MNKDLRRVYALNHQNKTMLSNKFGTIPDTSGIYILTRMEDGFKFAYIGQAKHILTRLAQHCIGYQAIDLSIKKHGWYDSDIKPEGWNLDFIECPEEELDNKEQEYILALSNQGYQLKNCTTGSQGVGKRSLENGREPRKYRDGIKQGRKNLSREIAHLFDLHLVVSTKKDPPTALQQKALDKFNRLMEEWKDDN